MHLVHLLDTESEKVKYKEVNLSKLRLKWEKTFGDLKQLVVFQCESNSLKLILETNLLIFQWSQFSVV